MTKRQMVIGSGDLSPRFTYANAKAELGPVAKYVLKLTGKSKPKICYIGTAAGYALDEGVSIHFIDGEPYKIIADTPDKFAYFVHKDTSGKAVEEKLKPNLTRL